MPSDRNGTPARLLLLALAALLTTACQLRLDVAVDVNRNGGGTLSVSVGADDELLARAAEADVDPLEGLVQAAHGFRAEGWRVAERSNGGARTVTLSREFDDPEEFDALAAQLSRALAADEVALLEPFTLEVTESRIAIEGAAGAQPRRAVRDYGLTRPAAVRLIRAEDALHYTVTVTLPGETLSTTADEPDASPLVWRIPVGEQVAIAAESTRPRAPVVRAIIGALSGALIAGALLWLWSRRRPRPEA